MPGAEPQIERYHAVAAVVHFEILVMEVVRVGMAIERDALGDFEPVEADMAIERTEAGEMQLEQPDDRVRRDDDAGSNRAARSVCGRAGGG